MKVNKATLLIKTRLTPLRQVKKTYWNSSHESRFQHTSIPLTALLDLGGL